MIQFRYIRLLAVTAALLLPSAADAKGGHSHGRARGTIGVQSTSQSVKGDPPASQLTLQATPTAAASSTATTTGTIPASSIKAVSTLPTPPPALIPTPASVIGAPPPQPQIIAPLSLPIPLSTTVGSGGSSGVSLPGGGGKSLQDCIAFWDRETHMTKPEWKAACQRSIRRLEDLPSMDLLPAPTPNR
jgi:hypothetical protein